MIGTWVVYLRDFDSSCMHNKIRCPSAFIHPSIHLCRRSKCIVSLIDKCDCTTVAIR